jgi:hypothetical protein
VFVEPLFALLLLWAPVTDEQAVRPGCPYAYAVGESFGAEFSQCSSRVTLPGKCGAWHFNGFLELDPRTMVDDPACPREWVIAHESAHALGVWDEIEADCWADLRVGRSRISRCLQ